ncbi:hypothetical protein FEM54_30715 [Pseudomonas edaphica]|uniref:DUF1534 domain-containing protein n=1 Tax=Pseudomonas edaphica TaxID=2006980 RepID=A0ABY2TW70_9PSED|nr:hypothetical protein FEM54_30715 [Pseudomonas edaphica]
MTAKKVPSEPAVDGDRSHAQQRNASWDALRLSTIAHLRRGASRAAFPRGAWERSNRNLRLMAFGHGL